MESTEFVQQLQSFHIRQIVKKTIFDFVDHLHVELGNEASITVMSNDVDDRRVYSVVVAVSYKQVDKADSIITKSFRQFYEGNNVFFEKMINVQGIHTYRDLDYYLFGLTVHQKLTTNRILNHPKVEMAKEFWDEDRLDLEMMSDDEKHQIGKALGEMK